MTAQLGEVSRPGRGDGVAGCGRESAQPHAQEDAGVRAAPHRGQGIILGIRPEDLYETPGEVPGGKPFLLEVAVDAVEPLGAETLLVLSLEGSHQELTARVGRSTRLRAGAATRIALDPDVVHLFDPASGRVIPRHA